MFRYITQCRACGSQSLNKVLDLGVQPLANDFCYSHEERAGYAPLEVLVCPKCFLGQLSVVVDPQILYRRYNYVTSPSKTMLDHFRNLASLLKREARGKTMLEIGSNDGRMLLFMQEQGYEVMGIDPAENLSAIATASGVNTVNGMFNSELVASCIRRKFDVVIARHVFCHIDNWHDFVTALDLVTHQGSLVCIEAPYAGDTVDKGEFDQVYHEHLSFLSLKSIETLLAETPFYLEKVERFSVHGGTVMLLIRRRWAGVPVPDNSNGEESLMGRWLDMAYRAKNQIGDLRCLIQGIRAAGDRVAAIGASAKSTVWVNACKFNENDIEFIADTTAQKIGRLSPGTKIPIVAESYLCDRMPDYLIVFCWNYRSEIIDKLKDRGSSKLIFPVPELEII